MPFYTKPLSQMDTADLQELFDEQAVENVRLEFKLTEPDKDETLKKLSSFANTYGGYMLVGAKADGKDGRLLGLPGVGTISGYKQKVITWCFTGATPPLTVEVSDPIAAPAGTGTHCYVVRVEQSDVAPHFLNGRRGVWVRTDEFSANVRFHEQLANDVELRDLSNRRQLVRERRANLIARAGRRFNTYLDQKHRAASGIRTNIGPLLEFCVAPRFPSRQLCAQSELDDRIMQSIISWRSGPFPASRGDVVYQHESVIYLDPTRATSFFEATVWGTLFYGATIRAESGEATGIHAHGFIGLLLLFLHHASKLLNELGYSGPVKIECAASPLLNVPWLHGAYGYTATEAGSPLDDLLAISVDASTDSLGQTLDAVAMEVLRPSFYSINWPNALDRIAPEKLITQGYEYNRWLSLPQSAHEIAIARVKK